jgi:uncharacterized membrane protein
MEQDRRTTFSAGEIVSALWLVVTGIAFFAPLLGIALPMGALTALYGALLLVSGATLALSLVSQKGKNKRVE